MKILHILHSFGFGGLEKGVATVIRQGSKDFEHLILCLAKSGESASLLPEDTRVLELHKQEGSSMRFLFGLAKTIRSLKPDVIHTRNWGGMDGIIAANLGGMRGRVVQGEHGWGMEDANGQNAKRRRLRRLFSLGVREFTCVSRQMEDWLLNEVKVVSPVTQVYNGIDTSIFSPEGQRAAIRQELDLNASTTLILSVGRLDPIKDQAGLIRAFTRIRHSYPDSALIIVGDGPERERLEAMQAPGVYLRESGPAGKTSGSTNHKNLPEYEEDVSYEKPATKDKQGSKDHSGFSAFDQTGSCGLELYCNGMHVYYNKY